MTPEELDRLKDKIEELYYEYYNGSSNSFSACLNDTADFMESLRIGYTNGKPR